MNLIAQLHRQKQGLEHLLSLLEAEQQALLSLPVDGKCLAELAREKQVTFTELSKLQNLRPSEDASDSPSAVSSEAGYPEQRRELHQLTERVRHMNQVNGSLICRQLIHNQKALNTLAELSGRHTYGADGRPRPSGRGLAASA